MQILCNVPSNFISHETTSRDNLVRPFAFSTLSHPYRTIAYQRKGQGEQFLGYPLISFPLYWRMCVLTSAVEGQKAHQQANIYNGRTDGPNFSCHTKYGAKIRLGVKQGYLSRVKIKCRRPALKSYARPWVKRTIWLAYSDKRIFIELISSNIFHTE